MSAALLEPDRDQIRKFVSTIFRHATCGGFVAVRSFHEGNSKVFQRITAQLIPTSIGGGLPFLVEVAEDYARRAAQNPDPVVFCPPLALFANADSAAEDNVVAGLALSVECDEHPQQARETLERILGPATVAVKSGGIIANGGEPIDKLHLHWRLIVAAQDKNDLAKLKRARTIACRLAGSDPTSNAVCHPMRWPGSWHRKAEPRLCEIETLNDIDINLDDALAALIAAATAAGVDIDDKPHVSGDEAQGEPGLIAAAFAVIPNDDLDWATWNSRGMAAWAATGGSAEGFSAFDTWSKKSKKYNEKTTRERWDHFFTSPPSKIGMGSIIFWANEDCPGWRIAYEERIFYENWAAMRKAASSPEVLAWVDGFADRQENADEEENENPDDGKAEQPKIEQSNDDAQPKQSKRQLLLSSKEFVDGFVPPDYLIDGLLQRRFVYSLTAPTGDGKTAIALRIAAHVANGLPIAGMDVEKGRVLFFAGENPDDVRTRWIKLCEEMRLNPDDMDVFFLSGAPPISTEQIRNLIEADVMVCGPIALLIVDTSAAYYSGDDENDNVALGNHARMLRSFVKLSGGPTILVTCHPTKNPDPNNLLPRGGGAFLAEVDGNLVCIRERGSTLVEINTHGKFRGPEFPPFSFKLVAATSDKLKDSKGRLIWTIYAEPVTEGEREATETALDAKRDTLLRAMKDRPASSIAELAVAVGWSYRNGNPNKSLVQRLIKQLVGEKLVEKKGHRYVLSKHGIAAVNAMAE